MKSDFSIEYANLNKKMADHLFQIRIDEIFHKHRKEIEKLRSEISSRGMTGQGPSIRAISELYDKHIKETAILKINCFIESLEKDKPIHDSTKREILTSVGLFIDNQVTAHNAKMKQELSARRFPEGAKKSALSGLKYKANIIKGYVKNILEYEIEKRKNDNTSLQKPIKRNDSYVDLIRIEELRSIENTSFDFTRLIQLCTELNIAYQFDNYISIIAIIRIIGLNLLSSSTISCFTTTLKLSLNLIFKLTGISLSGIGSAEYFTS